MLSNSAPQHREAAQCASPSGRFPANIKIRLLLHINNSILIIMNIIITIITFIAH